MSSVRRLRARRSSFNGLIRIPRKGGTNRRRTARNFRRRVLEIEAEILHRLALQFFDDPIVN